MRIIAGKLGGLQIVTPKGNRTHPMSERIRGALFNSLGDITDLTVLDAFAGTGAIAFEAISRGASKAVAIDSDKSAVDAMQDSVAKLNINDSCKVIRANVSSWSDNNPTRTFDLVVADPPYDKIQPNLLGKIGSHVKAGGLFVVSWPGKSDHMQFENFKIENVKNYGDAKLLFYRRSDA